MNNFVGVFQRKRAGEIIRAGQFAVKMKWRNGRNLHTRLQLAHQAGLQFQRAIGTIWNISTGAKGCGGRGVRCQPKQEQTQG